MNFNELLGGVGKEFMNAAGDALVGAAKEYLGNAIQEIFVKKEAETRRTLPNIQHMRVVSSPAVMRALLVQRIMFSVWRLLGDMAKQRLENKSNTSNNTNNYNLYKWDSRRAASREGRNTVTYGSENSRIQGNRSRLD